MLVRLMFVSRIRLLWNSSIPQKVQESAASFSSSRLQSLQDHSSHLGVKLQTQIHYYSQQDRANAGSITDGGCRELGAATRLDSVLIGRKSRSEVQLMNMEECWRGPKRQQTLQFSLTQSHSSYRKIWSFLLFLVAKKSRRFGSFLWSINK